MSPNPALKPERFVIRASVEQLVLAASLFWLLAGNRGFLAAALHGRPLLSASAAGLALALVALHALMLGLVAQRHTIKPLLALLTLATALSAWYDSRYGVVLDPSMVRNVLRTDFAEASELVGASLLLHLVLYAVLPVALLWRVELLPRRSWRHALVARALLLLGSAAVLVGAVLASYQPLSALMRNDRSLRYRIAPANLLWSSGAVMAADLKGAARPRVPIGLDARPGPAAAARQRPLVL